MPELPEVETIARGLAAKITGQTVARVHMLRKDMLHGNGGAIEQLVGSRIIDVRRCGKQVRMLLQDSDCRERAMYVHLGMTGRLIVLGASEPIAKHTHLRIDFARSRTELRFCDPRRFGGVWLIDESRSVDGPWRGRRLPPIGMDPLDITLAEMRRLLSRKRQIKSLLMDQQPISGMGNIYCDEALYRAGIHPLTSAAELRPEAVRRLRQAIRRVLTEAIRAGGSSISDYRTADNARGSFQERHRVYGREGQPCRNCGSIIERLLVAGRGTHICPRCQPLLLGKAANPRV